MSEIEHYFVQVIKFIDKYKNLIDCHLVDYLTENLWEKCLPNDLKLSVKKINFNFFYNDNFQRSNFFIQEIKTLILDLYKKDFFFNDLLEKIDNNSIVNSDSKNKLMKNKKWHEVDVYTKTIAWLNKGRKSIIIDAGAGKAYSSLHLNNNFNLPILAIESSQVNHKSALLQRNLAQKTHKQSFSEVIII